MQINRRLINNIDSYICKLESVSLFVFDQENFVTPKSMWKSRFVLFFLLFSTLISVAQQIPEPIYDIGNLAAQLQESENDTTRIRLLVQLANYNYYKGDQSPSRLGQSLKYIKEAINLSDSLSSDKWSYESRRMLGICYMKMGDFNKGIQILKAGISSAMQHGAKDQQATTMLWLGNHLPFSEHYYAEKISLYRQAAFLFRQTRNKRQEIVALKEIGDVHLNEGKLDSAETEFLQVVHMYKVIGYKKLHYTYDLLSALYRLRGDFDKSLSYAILCVKSMQATGDKKSAAYFYRRLAYIYDELGDRKVSADWFRLAFMEFKKIGSLEMYDSLKDLIRVLIKLNNAQAGLNLLLETRIEYPPGKPFDKSIVATALGDSYKALGHFDLAEKFYLEMITWQESLKQENFFLADSYKTIGTFYLEQKRYDRAAVYLNKALKLPKGIYTLSNIKDIQLLLFRVDSASGNYVSAIEHYQLHKALNDSIFNEARSKQIEELQVQYETEKKEQNIQLLLNKSLLQENKLQRANLLRNVTFACILSMLIIVALGYNRYRLKQASNQKLQFQQKEINQKNLSLQNLVDEKDALLEEKEWLLKEIHHRVKNNLQIVMSLLNSQSNYLESDAAVTAIRESKHRVQAISLIHQKLYQSDNVALISMQTYIPELVHYLKDSFDTRERIRFEDLIEPIELDVTQAVPIGLILNEAITNAIKYAFPNGENGLIIISMKEISKNRYELIISDNGIGLPVGFDFTKIKTLGMSLMRGLSKQLGGTFNLKTQNGLELFITFGFDKISRKRRTPSLFNYSEVGDKLT